MNRKKLIHEVSLKPQTLEEALKRVAEISPSVLQSSDFVLCVSDGSGNGAYTLFGGHPVKVLELQQHINREVAVEVWPDATEKFGDWHSAYQIIDSVTHDEDSLGKFFSEAQDHIRDCKRGKGVKH